MTPLLLLTLGLPLIFRGLLQGPAKAVVLKENFKVFDNFSLDVIFDDNGILSVFFFGLSFFGWRKRYRLPRGLQMF